MALNSIVRIYTAQIRPRARAELEWFRQQSDLKTVIELAGFAINSNGKRYSHQRRLKKKTLGQATRTMIASIAAIEKSRDFDELFVFIDSILRPIYGIGELYIYDTVLRIGAFLNLFPEKVYLHAGTRVGAKALGFDGKACSLEISLLPSELWKLAPHEIEDVLCIFKDGLQQMPIHLSDKSIRRRSWCD